MCSGRTPPSHNINRLISYHITSLCVTTHFFFSTFGNVYVHLLCIQPRNTPRHPLDQPSSCHPPLLSRYRYLSPLYHSSLNPSYQPPLNPLYQPHSAGTMCKVCLTVSAALGPGLVGGDITPQGGQRWGPLMPHPQGNIRWMEQVTYPPLSLTLFPSPLIL